MSDSENESLIAKSVREAFKMVTFSTPNGKKRSLRADFFYQAIEAGASERCNVYYESRRNSGYFEVSHSVEEVNQMVERALAASL